MLPLSIKEFVKKDKRSSGSHLCIVKFMLTIVQACRNWQRFRLKGGISHHDQIYCELHQTQYYL